MDQELPSKIVLTARKTTQTHLSLIASLDSRIQSIIHQSLLKQPPPSLNTILEIHSSEALPHQDECQKMWEQVYSLSQQKIHLAIQLYGSIAEAYTSIEGLISSNQLLYKSSQEKEHNEEESRLLAQCLQMEASNFCICSLRQSQKMRPDQLMVACEGKGCLRRWFHLRCLGLRLEELPEVFICQFCQSRQLQK